MRTLLKLTALFLLTASLPAIEVVSWNTSQVTGANSPYIGVSTALDTETPRLNSSNFAGYTGVPIFAALYEDLNALWGVGNAGASGLRIRFNSNTISDQKVSGLFLFSTSSVEFTEAEDTLDAADVHCPQIQRLSNLQIRFVVEDGGAFYISDASPNFASGSETGTLVSSHAIEAIDPGVAWYSYDPVSTAAGVATIGDAVVTPAFTDINFIGFLIEAEGASGELLGVNAGVRAFTATAFGEAPPEPAFAAVNYSTASAVPGGNVGSGTFAPFGLDTTTPTVTTETESDPEQLYFGPPIYGGLNESLADQGQWLVGNDGASGLRVRLNDSTAAAAEAIYLFQTTEPVSFAEGGYDVMNASNIFISQIQLLASATIRFVVRDGGSFYISAPSENFNTGGGETGNTVVSSEISALQSPWFEYDPSTAEGIGQVGPSATPAFDDIDFVGFTLFAAGPLDSGGGVNFGVRDFSVLAAPDSSVLAVDFNSSQVLNSYWSGHVGTFALDPINYYQNGTVDLQPLQEPMVTYLGFEATSVGGDSNLEMTEVGFGSGKGLKLQWNLPNVQPPDPTQGKWAEGDVSTGLFLFRQDNFLNGLDSGSVVMDSGSDTLTARAVYDPKTPACLTGATFRFVIEDSGIYYATDPFDLATTSSNYTVEATEVSWYSYDPTLSVRTIGEVARPSFQAIGFIGCQIEATCGVYQPDLKYFGVTVTSLTAEAILGNSVAPLIEGSSYTGAGGDFIINFSGTTGATYGVLKSSQVNTSFAPIEGLSTVVDGTGEASLTVPSTDFEGDTYFFRISGE